MRPAPLWIRIAVEECRELQGTSTEATTSGDVYGARVLLVLSAQAV